MATTEEKDTPGAEGGASSGVGSAGGTGAGSGGGGGGGIKVVDRRHWATEDVPAGGAGGRAEFPNYVEQLRAQLAEKEELIKDLMAGKDGARKKAGAQLAGAATEQATKELEVKKLDMIKSMLAALDNLQQCILLTDPRVSGRDGVDLRTLVEGMVRTYEALIGGFTKLGLKRIETRGQPFDPAVHQAVETQPAPDARLAGLVLAEIRTGFTLDGKLVRPAQVVVAAKR